MRFVPHIVYPCTLCVMPLVASFLCLQAVPQDQGATGTLAKKGGANVVLLRTLEGWIICFYCGINKMQGDPIVCPPGVDCGSIAM